MATVIPSKVALELSLHEAVALRETLGGLPSGVQGDDDPIYQIFCALKQYLVGVG